jgi:hypothetical protein
LVDERKCVVILNRTLPLGLLVNASAVMGVSLGQLVEGAVGGDLTDASGTIHRGITTIPIAMLGADPERLAQIVERARAIRELVLIDFTNVAQKSRSYDEYAAKLAQVPAGELAYLAVLLWGDRTAVSELTMDLTLLR